MPDLEGVAVIVGLTVLAGLLDGLCDVDLLCVFVTVADQVNDALGDVEGLNVIVTDVVGERVGMGVAVVVCVPERDCVCVALCDVDAVADQV